MVSPSARDTRPTADRGWYSDWNDWYFKVGCVLVSARRLPILLLACLCVMCVAGLFPPTASAIDGPEWQYALWVAGQLRDDPPPDPVVLLLGGSSAREAVKTNADWAADVEKLGGMRVTTYDLGTRRQTFEQELALVKTLPKTPMIVFIGINAGRFTADFTTTTDVTPPATKPTFVRHHYRAVNAWTPARKRERVAYWLERRQRLFNERFDAHAKQLDLLIETCVRRGYTTVVLALPRDIDAMGGDLSEVNKRYLSTGRRLAEKHGARFIDFVPDAQLSSDDFYDLDHLLLSGREVYQAWLAYETAVIFNAELAPEGSTPRAVAAPASLATPASPPASTPEPEGAHLWPAIVGVTLAGVALASLGVLAVGRSRASRRRADQSQRTEPPIPRR